MHILDKNQISDDMKFLMKNATFTLSVEDNLEQRQILEKYVYGNEEEKRLIIDAAAKIINFQFAEVIFEKMKTEFIEKICIK